MGLFDIFSRKGAQETDTIKRNIAELKADFQNLSEKVRVSDKNIEMIYNAMEEMLQDIEKNAKNISMLAKSSHSGQAIGLESANEDVPVLKSQLRALESKMTENRKKINELMQLSRLSIQNYDEIREIKQQIGSKERVQKAPSVNERYKPEGFSAKESKIINALLNSEIPLTYEEIAAQVNISPITVKGYINSIKRKNQDIIVENAKGKGRKAYSIRQEYKIKILSGKR
ncbi:Uncharacterised protein [uncultured archaeon]|nr:Uncharacterised protein [uncultured archaeon]